LGTEWGTRNHPKALQFSSIFMRKFWDSYDFKIIFSSKPEKNKRAWSWEKLRQTQGMNRKQTSFEIRASKCGKLSCQPFTCGVLG
jgi:hypothetical protein